MKNITRKLLGYNTGRGIYFEVLESQVGEQVQYQVWYEISDLIRFKVEDQVREQVFGKICNLTEATLIHRHQVFGLTFSERKTS
tara:strand:- start:60 stop:311 length:252 start_codon:yes stop_codon:yes gene_type:complete